MTDRILFGYIVRHYASMLQSYLVTLPNSSKQLLKQEAVTMTRSYSVTFEANIPVKMRDGTTTYADIFRPSSPGAFPALLQRTPYDKSSVAARSGTIDAVRAATEGYIVAIQDVRGRYSSEGDFYPFFDEIHDGYDSVQWLSGQPWCTGKVGMFGISYVGATQWLAAKSQPPSLSGLAAGFTASDYHEGWTWQGGAFELGFNLSWAIGPLASNNWQSLSARLGLGHSSLEKLIEAKDRLPESFYHLPMREMPHLKNNIAPYYYDWLEHPEYDDYWKNVSIEESHSNITVPTLNIGGWHDIFLGGTIRNYLRMQQFHGSDQPPGKHRLVIGPWIHSGSPLHVAGEYNFGTRAGSSSTLGVNLQDLIIKHYDYWLRGQDNGVADESPVTIFVMGENIWRKEKEWPLSRSINTNYYLHSRGGANTLNGDGLLNTDTPSREEPDVFVYNPLFPVPTRGGGLCCDPGFMAPGVYDQRNIEARPDVLVYTTSPLTKETEVTGPVTVTLYASTSAKDTDFTAKLVDVHPNGYARNLTDGIIRARYRHTRQAASLITRNEVVEYTIDLWATSNLFKAGHRIRLEISSSNFPRFDRNTNTGGTIGREKSFVSALQTVYHTSAHPSHVRLAIVPR